MSVVVEKRTDERGTSRLEAFSDGVFAIATTLLVLDIKVPEVSGADGAGALGAALINQWPRYASYILSFVTIGIVWANHHRMFASIGRTNHTFLVLNVLYLMVIGVFPFPTALLSRYIGEVEYPYMQQLVTLVYTGLSVLVSLLYLAVWLYATGRGNLLKKGVDPRFVARMKTRSIVGVGVFTTVFVVGFLNVYVSLGLLCCLLVFYLLPSAWTGLDR
ncbi:MAG TPA: TMEM175 family protein [Chloroflexia bacterium]|nr:TMEM175 family protein [Chloroflexia bacterium]